MSFTGEGSHRVVQGYDTFMRVTLDGISGINATNINDVTGHSFNIVVTGLPSNVKLHWMAPEWINSAHSQSTTAVTNDTITPYYTSTSGNLGLEFQIITNTAGTVAGPTQAIDCSTLTCTPVGSYTLTFTLNGPAGYTKSFTWSLNVQAATFTYGSPSSYPTLNYLTAGSSTYTYEDTMNTYAAYWCAQDRDAPHTIRATSGSPTSTCSLTGGSQTCSSYYDGVQVYYQIGDYVTWRGTGTQSTYAQCIANIHAVYRDGLIANATPAGNIQAFLQFAEGLNSDYIRTGNATSKTALASMASNGSYSWPVSSNGGGMAILAAQRETAYRLSIDYYNYKLTPSMTSSQRCPNCAGTTSPTLSYWVSFNLSHVIDHMLAECNGDDDFEYFMTGLEAKALIHYYEDGHSSDVRIPIAVKCAADYMYANGWGAIADDTDAFPYTDSMRLMGARIATGPVPDDNTLLNALILPMYGWLWRITGTTAYQTEGDTIWAATFNRDPSPDLGFNGNGGKQTSQTFYWTEDYVKWRTAPSTKHTGKGVTIKGGTIR
jgi:hypothetical protein